jgi:mRNA interferase HigB
MIQGDIPKSPIFFFYRLALIPCWYHNWAMRIVAITTLQAFWEKHPDAKAPLQAWYALASRAGWKSPTDIKAAYRNASFIANERVVFNIKGNDYRLVVLVLYRQGLMFIRFVGSQSLYNKIDVSTI